MIGGVVQFFRSHQAIDGALTIAGVWAIDHFGHKLRLHVHVEKLHSAHVLRRRRGGRS